MATRLRRLSTDPTRAASRPPSTAGVYWCGVCAVVLQFVFSTNVLVLLGYKANVHPATFLIMMYAVYAMVRGTIRLWDRFRSSPALMLFVFGIPVVALYSIYWTGFSGSTIFAETFWSAGILAVLLESATARQKRMLGWILITLVIANVFIALYESSTHAELFPLSFDESLSSLPEAAIDDFRAHAFYEHPLTASLVTSMAFYLLYAMRLRLIFSAPLFGLLLVGLLAFGGRTALGVTTVVAIASAFYMLITGLAKRKLSLEFMLTIFATIVIVPLILAIIVSDTTIADRIVHNLYFDDSAAVRTSQWSIFDHLSLNDWLFGISRQRLGFLKDQIGLGAKDTDIENFWILIFLDLGVFGFAMFAALFCGFLVHLGRYTNSLNSWLLVGSALVIDSTSNSLGVWSSDLFLEVAFVIAISGFRAHVLVRDTSRVHITLPTFRRAIGINTGLIPTSTALRTRNLRGL